MRNESYSIRTMTRNEADLAIEWAASEGWNPGLHDMDCFHAADPGGFFIGFFGNEPVSVISAVKYGRTFGFIGFYMVKPGYRGMGYGRAIWDAALDYLKGRTIGLDGVIAQQENYRISGFCLAFRNIRFQGNGGGKAPACSRIVRLSTVPYCEIQSYDGDFFPDDREAFLRKWVRQPSGFGLGVKENDRMAGYGIIRKCLSGYKIGPLFADSPEYAEQLFAGLSSSTEEDDTIYLDVPSINEEAMAMARRHRMSASFETARMYTGDEPKLPMDRTFELG